MGDQDTVKALTSVRVTPPVTKHKVIERPFVPPRNPTSNTTRERNPSQKKPPARNTKDHNSTKQSVQHTDDKKLSQSSKGSKEGIHKHPEPNGHPKVQFVPNGITDSNRVRQFTFTSNKPSDRQGTFTKDTESFSSGFDVPRITSASMPQKQVIRTDGQKREREVVVSIVDSRGEESPDHVESAVTAETKLDPVKDSDSKTVSKGSAKSINNRKGNQTTGPVNESPTVLLKNKQNANNPDKNAVKTKMGDTEETKENHLNTDSVSSGKAIEKSFDRTTPFRVSNSGNIETGQDLTETGSKKDSKLLPPKTPVPAEPVIHKKSDFVSQNRKKPTSDSPESMATYDSSSMVHQAAMASEQTDSGDKPLSDDRIERLTVMLNQMSEKLAESEERNKELRQKNDDLEEQARRHNDVQSKTSAELQLLKKEWNELTKDLEASRKEREKMGEELKSKGNEDKEQLKVLTEQNTKLDAELAQARADMKELIVTREKENKAHEDIMQALELELATAKKNVSDSGTTNEKKLKELQEMVEKLQAEIDILSKTVKNLETAKADAEEDVKASRQENEELKQKLNRMNSENQKLLEQLSKMKLEVSNLTDYKKESEDLGQEVEALLREKQALSEAVQEKDRIIEKQQNDIKSIDGLAQTLQKEQEQNAKLAKQVNSLTEENLSLRKQANDSNKELSDLRKKLGAASEKVETGKVALSSMSELIKEKQAHIEDLQKEVKTLAETNSNYLVAIETFSSTKKKDDEVAKSKFEDIESSYKRLLEENKRLRTVLTHKNMTETSRNAESEDLMKVLDQKDAELDRSKERIAHLEAMMDDVYKTREIQMMQGDLGHEEESKMSISSLPDIRQESRATGYSHNSFQKGRTKSQEARWANYVENDQVSRNLRNYRDAVGYAQRFEHRPKKKQRTGVLTKLK